MNRIRKEAPLLGPDQIEQIDGFQAFGREHRERCFDGFVVEGSKERGEKDGARALAANIFAHFDDNAQTGET